MASSRSAAIYELPSSPLPVMVTRTMQPGAIGSIGVKLGAYQVPWTAAIRRSSPVCALGFRSVKSRPAMLVTPKASPVSLPVPSTILTDRNASAWASSCARARRMLAAPPPPGGFLGGHQCAAGASLENLQDKAERFVELG